MNEKKCLYCGKKIEGRIDKKYCDHNCRNAFNNNTIRDTEKYIFDINRILRKNRTILRQINPQGKSTIRKDYLVMLGFNFNFYTHQYIAKNSSTYNFCYEYGYILLADNEKVTIVNWQGYMEKSQ